MARVPKLVKQMRRTASKRVQLREVESETVSLKHEGKSKFINFDVLVRDALGKTTAEGKVVLIVEPIGRTWWSESLNINPHEKIVQIETFRPHGINPLPVKEEVGIETAAFKKTISRAKQERPSFIVIKTTNEILQGIARKHGFRPYSEKLLLKKIKKTG